MRNKAKILSWVLLLFCSYSYAQISNYDYKRECIFLDVLTFNKRAIKAYEKCGFRVDSRYSEEYEGVKYDFIRMFFRI